MNTALKSSFSTASLYMIPSISFSGAGFLGCYHVGVAACLLKHGLLLKPMERISDNDNARLPPILTGVSAGSLICASLSAGVSTDDAMDLNITLAKRTNNAGGAMDVLRPGYVYSIKPIVAVVTG